MELRDIDLVTVAKAARDSAAFEALVRRHQAPLRAFLTRLTGEPALADDLAQEAFLKAYRALDAFRGGSSFRSWLFAIAMREAQMARRREAVRAKAQHGAGGGEDAAAPAEFSLDLQRALAALTQEERTAALLCDAAGFSHAEAASAMAAPLGTVKTLVARAREKLRASMTEERRAGAAVA